MKDGEDLRCTDAQGDIFATTRWTVVLAAGERHTAQADAALEQLCRAYWVPLYVFVRRRGYAKEDAEDLTQAFFARLLKRNDLQGVSAERGRFRAFLLAALKNFLANEWDKSQRRKRGGQFEHFSLDWSTAETQFQLTAASADNPDRAFDREWALALLETVIERMAAEWASEGRAALFDQLKIFLTTDKGTRSYAETAQALGMEEGTVRVAAHRLRKSYRQVLRSEIAQTLADPAQVEEEMRTLFESFRS